MKKTGILICFLLIHSTVFSEPKLESYLLNDLELKKLALEYQKSQLSAKKSRIDNGISVELATGTARFQIQEDDFSASVSPSVSMSVPQASNLSLKLSSTLKITDSENNSSDSSIQLGADLISASSLNRKITLKKAERTVLEAKRKFQNRAIEAEKEYYNQLKSLFEAAANIVSKQKDLYDDKISFDEIRAKGYSTSSSKYRQAEMKVVSDQHEVDTLIHTMDHDCAVFASKCGAYYDSSLNPQDFLPSEIQETAPVDFSSFKKEDFAEIESSTYAHGLAEMQRKADRDFTLTATTGYTLKNSNTSFSSGETTVTDKGTTTISNSDKSDTIDAGLTATWKGLTVGAGVNIPISSGNEPVYTLSATVKPNTFRTRKITHASNELTEEQELIDIQSAEESYETALVDKKTELDSIMWTKKTYKETFDLWNQLENDEKKWFREGIVKESEYLNASANRKLYRLKLMINQIDLIIYNAETKLLFCRDYEFSQ